MADVKLLAPQRITDNPDGGGLATSVEIVDGEINNLFDDISRIDRINGDVSLRKVFPVANTPDNELFSGLHVIIREPPMDPRVGAVLFSADGAGGWAGTRTHAQAFVERYVDQSVPTRMIPYDRALAAQRSVLVFQRPEASLPTIGEVYVLANEATDQVEFVRVQDFSHEVQTFSDYVYGSGALFEARVITLTLSQPLTQEFLGSEPNIMFRAQAGRSIVRETMVSDAARYRGTVVLAEDAEPGDLTIRVASVFGQLVPAATQETAITDAAPQGATMIIAASDDPIALVIGSVNTQGIHVTRLPVSAEPGSVVFQRDGGSWNIRDDGQGNIINVAAGNAIIGSVDYGAGVLTRVRPFGDPTWEANTTTVTFVPAARVSTSGLSAQIPVTVGTRGFVYSASLRPIPAPDTLVVSFRANGRWYDLVDDGTGALRGDTGAGVGQINFATGTATVTLGALPDVGSKVIFAWGSDTTFEVLTDDLAGEVPQAVFTLSKGNCEPGTLAISWTAGGVDKAAVDNGAGLITGDATGRVVYGSGRVAIRPTILPDPNATFVCAYEGETVETELLSPSKVGSTITITAAEAPVRPRSILITYQQTIDSGPLTATTVQQLTDNGAGELVDADGNIKAGSVVNYTTGAITFNPDFTALTPTLNYERFERRLPARVNDPSTGYFADIAAFGEWPVACGSQATSVGFINGTNVTLQYKPDAVTDADTTDEFVAPPLSVDFVRGRTNTLVPGGMLFRLGGRQYFDRAGSLYHSINQGTGAAVLAGTVSYSSGVATITDWLGGAAPAYAVDALLTSTRSLPQSVVTGRTPGAPLRPASFFIQANRYSDGALLSGVADQNGNILTASMRGTIDINTGVYTVAFGAWVLDSALTSDDKLEPWYNAANIDADGYIWRPAEVTPGTVRYSCVVQTSLPLDPTIIGVNPVRLPIDGRVQIIRPGDTLIIHDTQTIGLATPVAGATITLPRGGLAANGVRVFDATAPTPLVVDPDLYAVDAAAGELTWADPLDLTDYTGPFTASHTVEDGALCTDAQITGIVSIAQPLTHAYSADVSLCSSAVVIGDVSARYRDMRALNTWVGDWTSEGPPPTSGAQYNEVAFPLQLVNRDTITQKWRLSFTTATAFNVVAEELGIVASGTTAADVAPINPQTGQPYFLLDKDGFGTGWATGNQIVFETVAAGAGLWVGRVTRPGPATFLDDRIQLSVRWDKD